MNYRMNHFSANGHSQPDYGRLDYDGYGGGRDYQRGREVYASRADDYGRSQNGGDEIREYFRMLAEERMPIPEEIADVIICVVKERMNHILAGHGYHEEPQHGGSEDYQHRRFKEVLEELRNSDPKETAKRIDDHFRDLRPEERKLLTILSQERSKKQIADNAGLPSVARMMEIKRGLEHKLK